MVNVEFELSRDEAEAKRDNLRYRLNYRLD